MNEREFLPLAIAVLTVSDTRTEADDASGRALVGRLAAAGHRLADRAIVPDDIYRVRAVVSGWIADPAVAVVLVTGGTGMTGRDSTPEAVRPLLDKEITGFGELFRMLSWEEIGAASANTTKVIRCIKGVHILLPRKNIARLNGATDFCGHVVGQVLRENLIDLGRKAGRVHTKFAYVKVLAGKRLRNGKHEVGMGNSRIFFTADGATADWGVFLLDHWGIPWVGFGWCVVINVWPLYA